MSTCAYAGCNERGPNREDGWQFCLRHLHEHRALRDGHSIIVTAEHLAEIMQREQEVRCGTEAGHRWHLRHGTEPCTRCLDALATHQRHRRSVRAYKATA